MTKASIVRNYFQENPDKLYGQYGKTASELGVDYDSVYRVAKKMKQEDTANPDSVESTSETTTDDYVDVVDLENSSLKSYCEAFGIPFEYVTSAKFVNHQGQEAWNTVCDLTKVTPAFLDQYFDKLKSALTSVIEPVQLPVKPADVDAQYTIYFSDMHVGAAVGRTAMYGNKYNADVFRERMFAAIDDYREEASLRGRFDKLLIANLGDHLDGFNKQTTRPGTNHILPQNLDNREQFDVYVKTTIEFMETIIGLDLANEIELISVSNCNHSGDFGYTALRAVQIYLNAKYPEIKTRITEKLLEPYEYGIHALHFTHGKDKEFMKFGMPLILNDKTEQFINDYLIQHDCINKVNHVIKGDLHQSATQYGKYFRYRNCLSLFGSSEWVQTNFGSGVSGISSEIIYKTRNKVSVVDTFVK